MQNLELIPTPAITTYRYGEFIVEIVDDGKELGAWIHHPAYSVKMFMFSVERKNGADFTELVMANVDGYVADYQQEYMGP